jgi:hypothetical protein
MTEVQRYKAENIYNTISSQRFADWYGCPTDDADGYRTGGDFELYICADQDAHSKEEILQQIVELFNL